MKTWGPRVLTLAVAFALGACAVGPDYVPPELPAPPAWDQSAPEGEVEIANWWERFGDEQLGELVQRATAGNLDLRAAYERIAEFRHALQVTSVRLLPDIDTTQSATRSDASTASTGFNTPPTWTYDIGLSVGWELDVFGRVRRSIEAATADFETVVEDYRSVVTSLHADVATAYIDVRLAQRRLAVARANVAIQRGGLTYASDRHEAGLVPGLDIAQAESSIATTEATIPSLEVDLDRAIYRLAVLLGSSIAPLREELAEVRPIPLAPAEIATGLPVNLIRNRPDLRAAERSLAAETARIGIAEADLYPSFDLSAALGQQALELGDLFDGGARRWSVGVNSFTNVFNFGGVQANVKAQEARAQQALTRYQQTLLLSIEEVEAAMTAQRRERRRAEALRRAVAANERSVDFSEKLYRGGEVDFQNLRDTQRTLLDVQDQLAVSEATIAKNMVTLFLALGGSWDADEDLLGSREGANE